MSLVQFSHFKMMRLWLRESNRHFHITQQVMAKLDPESGYLDPKTYSLHHQCSLDEGGLGVFAGKEGKSGNRRKLGSTGGIRQEERGRENWSDCTRVKPP